MGGPHLGIGHGPHPSALRRGTLINNTGTLADPFRSSISCPVIDPLVTQNLIMVESRRIRAVGGTVTRRPAEHTAGGGVSAGQCEA